MSRFFIDRPIFAAVIAILSVVAGAVSLDTLPISQYPDLAPPVV
jgi:multidrug efflux pump subunit AcrB